MASLCLSVIIPTFNRANWIRRAIASALLQILPGDEIIVVDDGSTDNTADVVANIDPRVRYVPIPNGGAGKARNVGIDHAQHELIAFLDSDDEWFPGKIALQRALMEARPDVLFSFSNFSITRRDGEAIPYYLHHWLLEPMSPKNWDDAIGPAAPFSTLATLPADANDVPVHIGDLSASLMLDNYVLTSSLVVRRQEAGNALRFAEDLPIFEDWYCFARLSLRGTAAYFDCDMAWQHGLAETRISDAGTLARAEAWNQLNERIWLKDADFCRRNAALHAQRVARNCVNHARGLIGVGQSQQARRLLAGCVDAPLSYRLLAQLPEPVLRVLSATRRRLAASA